MLQINQISFISSAEVHPRKLFIHLFHFPGRLIIPKDRMKDQRMSLTFNIVNICDINTHHTAFYIYHNHLCFSLFHTFDRAIQSLGERKIRNWFQHIIQRVYRITSNCILCHVCNKDDYNFTVHFTDFFRSGHSIHEFHLNIHKDNIKLGLVFIYNLISV